MASEFFPPNFGMDSGMKKTPAKGEGRDYEVALAVIALIPAIFHPLGKSFGE